MHRVPTAGRTDEPSGPDRDWHSPRPPFYDAHPSILRSRCGIEASQGDLRPMPGAERRRLELQRGIAALRRRGYSIRTALTALIAVVLAPALLLGGWLASVSADAQRSLLEERARREAREIVDTLDREILNARNVLIALSGSPTLQGDDIAGFARQARDVTKRLGMHIVLRDPAVPAPLVNTAQPAPRASASPQPPERAAAEQEAMTGGRPVVSNLFMSPFSDRLVASVIVPVEQSGSPRYALSVGIPARRFAELLTEMQLPAHWTTTLYDRNTVIVARSSRNDEFAGTRVRETPELRADESIRSGTSRDGIAYSWFRHQSAAAGWFVSIGVPQSALNAASRKAFLSYGIAGSLLLAGGLGLAYHLGGRLSESVGALGIDRKPTREEFQVLFEYAPGGVVVVDSDGKIALVNEQMERMFRYRREDMIGKPVEFLFPERLLGSYAKSGSVPGAGSAGASPSGSRQDLYGRRSDGVEFPFEIGLNPISTPGGNMVIATMTDITARKEAAERLARTIAERDDLRRRLMQAQEDERLRLARELHDQTGQSLTAVMLQLKAVESIVAGDGRDRLRLLRKQLEEMGKTLHRVAWELRPASIDELGLASALTHYIADWGAQAGVEADFHCRDTRLDLLPEEVRTTLYRVVQEALTNIAKHAQGTTAVSVVIDRSDGVLRLTIEDDGLGFAPTASGEPDRRGGLGLAGMRERLALIGGELELESSPGAGTTIFARVPLEQERLIA